MNYKVYATNQGYVSIHVYSDLAMATALRGLYGFKIRKHRGEVYDASLTSRALMAQHIPTILATDNTLTSVVKAKLQLAHEYATTATPERRFQIVTKLRRPSQYQ